MSQRLLGFDIGAHCVHIVSRTSKGISRVVTEPIPETLIHDRKIQSPEVFGDFLRQVCHKNRLRGKAAAVVLPTNLCYCRRLNMPTMTRKQLEVNLPYEFRDFIVGNKSAYNYDCAVLGASEAKLELLAAAALKTTVAEYKEVFRRAGLKLKAAVPVEAAYSNYLADRTEDDCGRCIIDLGHTSVRLYIFSGTRFVASHILDFGCSVLAAIVAEEFNVNPQTASAYLEENRNNCQYLAGCEELYRRLADEIQKAIYFSSYNNPDFEIERIDLVGGGAGIEPLCKTLSDTLTVPSVNVCNSDIGSAVLAAGACCTDIGRRGLMRTKLEDKHSVNLLVREKTLASPSRLIPILLAIFCGAGVFAKFCVISRLNRVNAAEAELRQLAGDLDGIKASYSDYSEVLAEYNRYTYRDFDLTVPDCLDVLELLERDVFSECTVESLSLNGRTLYLTVSGVTLEQTSCILASLEADVLVDDVIMSTATNSDNSGIVASMTVTLADASTMGGVD